MSEKEPEEERDSAFGPMAMIELTAVALVLAYSLVNGGMGGKPAEVESKSQITENPTPQP